MKVLNFFYKRFPKLVFRYRLKLVINRCADKYPYNNTKSTCIVYRWIQRYVNKEEGIDKQRMVRISWNTGRLVKDVQREAS
jgi:hypothetical protein